MLTHGQLKHGRSILTVLIASLTSDNSAAAAAAAGAAESTTGGQDERRLATHSLNVNTATAHVTTTMSTTTTKEEAKTAGSGRCSKLRTGRQQSQRSPTDVDSGTADAATTTSV